MSKYSSDELEAPEWLNKSFLEKILKQSEEYDNVKVIDFSISPATEGGYHFASIIFRIAVDYLISNEPKKISLILKTMPVKEGAKKEFIGSSPIFETEIAMYSEIIPKFHKILKEIGDDTILGTRMIYSSLEPIKIIILEDLKKQGYQMVPNKYLEPHEIDAVLKKICRWHAISFKLIKEGDESIKRLKHGILNMETTSMDNYIDGSVKGFSDLLIREDLDPVYLKKIENIKGNLIQKCKDIYKLQGDLCVLNHGDFHINNTMVKIGLNGTIDDLMLLDFQFCIAAPLTIDLTYLLSSLLNPNCRKHRDEIIYKYHTLFVAILHKLGYEGKMPTLHDLHRELMLYKELELITLIHFLPLLCAAKIKYDFDSTLMEDPAFFLKFFEIPEYVNLVKKILPELLYKGYLD